MEQRRWIICDIDGTLCDGSRRFVKIPDWEAVHEGIEDDLPYLSVMELLRHLSGNRVLLLTGRPNRYRGQTLAWMNKWGVDFHDLVMRPDHDFTPDVDLKWNQACAYFGGEQRLREKVFMIIEDRDRVVEMWRNNDLFCIQPRLGDY